ncbi:MAG: hypothetical protein IPN87_15705 [Saprospiraceae bacterium]|nr:hypothetical protein [Candidatus Brachybacter algidus]
MAVTGSPGVGKNTLIEALGMSLSNFERIQGL